MDIEANKITIHNDIIISDARSREKILKTHKIYVECWNIQSIEV